MRSTTHKKWHASSLPSAQALLKNLCAPDKPNDKSYDDLVKKLTSHLSPKPSEIAERFRFHKREQGPGESVNKFVADLRRLAIHCNFDTALSKTLRDRFVCGLCAEHIQNRLLAGPELTFDTAIKIAVSMETASRDASELQSTKRQVTMKGAEAVHKFTTSTGPRPKQRQQYTGKTHATKPQNVTCYRCGDRHKADRCQHVNTRCRYCGKIGHLEKVCLSKKKDQKAQNQGSRANHSVRGTGGGGTGTTPYTNFPHAGQMQPECSLQPNRCHTLGGR